MIMLVAGIGLVAFRDPNGIRPLVLGKKEDSYMVASETSALSALGYSFIRDVAPGECVVVSEQGRLLNKRCAKKDFHLI